MDNEIETYIALKYTLLPTRRDYTTIELYALYPQEVVDKSLSIYCVYYDNIPDKVDVETRISHLNKIIIEELIKYEES